MWLVVVGVFNVHVVLFHRAQIKRLLSDTCTHRGLECGHCVSFKTLDFKSVYFNTEKTVFTFLVCFMSVAVYVLMLIILLLDLCKT